MSDGQTRPDGEFGGMGASRPEGAPRVLVVEPIQSTRELMELVLQRHYRTQTAATYEQALRRAAETPVDGIVMNANLRGAEATADVIEKLRAAEGETTVAIIVLIGPSLDGASECALEAGADDFLRMPFVRSELLVVLGEHLGEKKQ